MAEHDEALVRKAAETLLSARRLRWDSVHQGECITDARAVLDAVAPAIEARALRNLAGDIDPTGYGWASIRDAERFRARLRDRADRIEGEIG